MSDTQLIRKLVWSPLQRGLHWLLALTSINLIATSWLMDSAPYLREFAYDWHLINGNLLLVGIVLRLGLLIVGSRNLHWKALLPDPKQASQVIAMLKFYVTLGRTPLPRWYAHNPLWKPVYVIAMLLIVIQTVTGVVMELNESRSVFNLILHQNLAVVLTVFAVTHFLTVVFHDVRGDSSDVSAMLNGHRIYPVDKPDEPASPAVQKIDIKDLLVK